MNFLDFEQPIAELEAKIEELRYVGDDSDININDEINRLKKRSKELTQSIFSSLTAWQVSQISRHPQRPYSRDYIERIFTDFNELHGDRSFGDDPAIVTGMARFEGEPVMIIGHQKGRDIRERIYRNYGMPKPEGYRKAKRVMELAERYRLPVLTFIDTPGAYPGVGAEERGQSEAIAANLQLMAGLKTPVIATVIGEGGSGGALAIGVADRLFHAGVQHLFGNLAGGLRLHPVEERGQGGRGGRGHGHHCRAPAGNRADRRPHQGAAGRRPPRLRPGRRKRQERPAPATGRAVGNRHRRPGAAAAGETARNRVLPVNRESLIVNS